MMWKQKEPFHTLKGSGAFFEHPDIMATITVVPDAAAVPEERQSQLEYWKHHVAIEATVETMMLDSQASVIDEMERPEILGEPSSRVTVVTRRTNVPSFVVA